MFDARKNARLKELTDLIEKQRGLGKVAELLAGLNNLLDEQAKPSAAIMGRSHSRAHNFGVRVKVKGKRETRNERRMAPPVRRHWQVLEEVTIGPRQAMRLKNPG